MDADNRDFFRLQDDIQISFKVVSHTDAKNQAAEDFFPASTSFELSSDIYSLEMESNEILHTIHQQNRQLASLLANINKRIELISRAVITNSQDEDHLDHSHAEISEGGLSFTTEELIQEGQVLALRLIFHPSLLGMSCFAEVKNCRPSPIAPRNNAGSTFKIGTQFIEMDQTQKRILGRHIIRRQSEIRREQTKRNTK